MNNKYIYIFVNDTCEKDIAITLCLLTFHKFCGSFSLLVVSGCSCCHWQYGQFFSCFYFWQCPCVIHVSCFVSSPVSVHAGSDCGIMRWFNPYITLLSAHSSSLSCPCSPPVFFFILLLVHLLFYPVSFLLLVFLFLFSTFLPRVIEAQGIINSC